MMTAQKNKENIIEALAKNLPAIPKDIKKGDIVGDTEEDYEYARGKLKKLIDQSEEAIESLLLLAGDTEHPRAFEVLGQLLRGTGDITDKLLQLQKQRKELTQEESTGGANTTNNTLFVGSTTELQKFLKNKKENFIDVDEE